MKVAVSVHGRFHGFDLARELQAQGHLAGLITTYPAFAVRRHLAEADYLATAPWLELRRRFCQKTGLCGDIDASIAAAFGRFAAARLPADMDLLVGWSGATLEAMAPARARGARVVIERGSTHIQHQTDLLTALYARHGRTFASTSAAIVERELAEYDAADAIAVPSSFAAETFTARGVAGDKLMVNPYGVDLSQFSPPPKSRDNRRPRILFVGRVGLRKGVPDLLDAFAPLAGTAELHLVGPVEADYAPPAADGVTVRGPLPMAALPAAYAAADIFCLPSWEEGFPLVLLQAMASGLPVVASDATGAADIVSPGQEGEIVAAGDIAALSATLTTLVTDAEQRMAMGAAARARVADGFGWADYGARAVGHYRRMLSAY